jgi:hypothetical protein
VNNVMTFLLRVLRRATPCVRNTVTLRCAAARRMLEGQRLCHASRSAAFATLQLAPRAWS